MALRFTHWNAFAFLEFLWRGNDPQLKVDPPPRRGSRARGALFLEGSRAAAKISMVYERTSLWCSTLCYHAPGTAGENPPCKLERSWAGISARISMLPPTLGFLLRE
jgi:hypothetical protein